MKKAHTPFTPKAEKSDPLAVGAVVQLTPTELEAINKIDVTAGRMKLDVAHIAIEVDRLQTEQAALIAKIREQSDLYLGTVKSAARAHGIDPEAGPDGPQWVFDGPSGTFTRKA